MKGFKNVAIVKLLEDYNKKDYAFALYDEELNLLTRDNQLVIVNAKSENNRIVGAVQFVMNVEDYFAIDKNRGTKITAQVVGVVNMDGYISRVEEENRLKEIAKKKAEIEKALDAEIKKRKDAEYYEEMAKKYSDNPLITQLVSELKELGV